ncbi:MAG: dTMP kinase, partial [Actinomycetota bacterium]
TGERIHKLLLDAAGPPISPKTEALLYAADRAQHVEQAIRPALERGTIVLSDRYLDSSLAYQGSARGLGIEEVFNLNRWAVGGLLPDLVFLLDTDPAVGLRRAGAAGPDAGPNGSLGGPEGADRIEAEGPSFHQKVRSAYHQLSQRYPSRFVVIDASQPPEAVQEEVQQRVLPFLERPGRQPAESPL